MFNTPLERVRLYFHGERLVCPEQEQESEEAINGMNFIYCSTSCTDTSSEEKKKPSRLCCVSSLVVQ